MASKTPCFICLKQSHLDAFIRPHVGLCHYSEQIGKQHDVLGKSQRAAITCSFANAPQLHWAHVWFLSGCPSFPLFCCSHSHFTSITCSSCLYHWLFCLSFSLFFSFLPVSPCQPVGLPVFGSFSFSLGPFSPFLFLSHFLLPLLHFKMRVSWLLYLLEMPAMIVSFIRRKIIRQVYSCPLHFLCVISFLLYLRNEVLQQ